MDQIFEVEDLLVIILDYEVRKLMQEGPIVVWEGWTGENSSQEGSGHGLFEGVLPVWGSQYLKGIEKGPETAPRAKYSLIQLSTSLPRAPPRIPSAMNLKALRMQYLVISSFVFRSPRNFPTRRERTPSIYFPATSVPAVKS